MIVKEYLSKTYSVSQESVNNYAKLSGGFGRIHVDTDYAMTTKYKGTIVHGLYLVSIIENELNRWLEGWSDEYSLELTFIKPVKVDQDFEIYLKEELNGITAELFTEDQLAIVGKLDSLRSK